MTLLVDDCALAYPLVVGPGADWSVIARPEVPLLLELRRLSHALARAARGHEAELKLPLTPVDALQRALAALPPLLADDIASLAGRFADTFGLDAVQLRFEVIAHDACRRFHADMTDVRLVCCYDGPGTDYHISTAADAPVERMATGAIALFKGRGFGAGEAVMRHPVILHRSPPIAGTGLERRLLVIDTPRLGAGNRA